MAPQTIEVTAEQLKAHRQRILQALEVSERMLRAREQEGGLSSEERDALSQLAEISFLLDDK